MMIRALSLAALSPTSLPAMRNSERIMLCIWFIIVLMMLGSLMAFYGWTFLTVGVPSESSLTAYTILGILTTIIFVSLIVGMFFLSKSRCTETSEVVMGYNVGVGLVMLITMALTLLFAQHVTRQEMVQFLEKPHFGSAAFLEYIHRKFNCCVLLSPANMTNTAYEYENSTESPAFISSFCLNDMVNKGCLDHVTTLTELLSQDKEAYTIHLLQTYLPVIFLVGVLVLMLLFNAYISYGDRADSRDRDANTLANGRPRDNNEITSVICAGFSLQGGTSPVHPSPQVPCTSANCIPLTVAVVKKQRCS